MSPSRGSQSKAVKRQAVSYCSKHLARSYSRKLRHGTLTNLRFGVFQDLEIELTCVTQATVLHNTNTTLEGMWIVLYKQKNNELEVLISNLNV
jgi:hypothetical protein